MHIDDRRHTQGRPPTITVGLPVYNGERYLEIAIRSILGQDLDDLELVIGDNASRDATEDICRTYAAQDERVRYVRSDVNLGSTWNYNRLVDLASGRYFKWHAHDDVCRPTLLSTCVDMLEHAPATVTLCYPATSIIDQTGRVVDEWFHDGLDFRQPDPVDRLRPYFRHQGEQHAIFGVMRIERVRRSRLIAACWGGDIVLLAELLVSGEFWETPERLFLRRYHDGTSLVANASANDVAAWFDPRNAGHITLPRIQLFTEIASRLLGAPVSRRTRARALGCLTSEWASLYWRHMGGEVKLALRHQSRPTLTAARGI
jgi:glycosyltransferase involved in cell wall biosynthesis